MRSMSLGVLDVSAVWPGSNPRDVIWATIEVAPLLEEWGYRRLWLAEHHEEGAAHSSPELLVPIIAGLTEHIRVGVAGVLLNLHRPLKVAKDFRLLHAIYTNRVDLGLARSTTREDQMSYLKSNEEANLDFEDKVVSLLGFLRGTSEVHANPRYVWPPNVWMLGSGETSALLAARYGTRFCLATQFSGKQNNPALAIDSYRKQFNPSLDLESPECAICVAGICAATDEEADALMEQSTFHATIVGSPLTCAKKLRDLRNETGVDEFVWLDLCRKDPDRRNSYRLLAEAVLGNQV